MKSSIPTPLAVALIVLFVVGVFWFGWQYMGSHAGVRSDVKPLVKEMNAGKPQTELLSPEEAAGDAMLMGSKGAPKSGNAKSGKKK
jgi:hypothetical protein